MHRAKLDYSSEGDANNDLVMSARGGITIGFLQARDGKQESTSLYVYIYIRYNYKLRSSCRPPQMLYIYIYIR